MLIALYRLLHARSGGVGDHRAMALSLHANAESVRRLLFHETVHWYNDAAEEPLPLWLEEGLAEVYSTFQVSRDGMYSFGHPIASHRALLKTKRAIDVQQAVQTVGSSPEYNETTRATRFYARSWALVHYLLFGKGSPGLAGIARYRTALQGGMEQAGAFELGFGADYETFNGTLLSYVRGGTYRPIKLSVQTLEVEEALQCAPATPAEIERSLGILLLGSRGEATPAVLAHLLQAVALEPDDAFAWQALGDIAIMERRPSEAVDAYSRAVTAGSRSAHVYYSRAQARITGRQGLPSSGQDHDLQLSAGDYREAIALDPVWPEA